MGIIIAKFLQDGNELVVSQDRFHTVFAARGMSKPSADEQIGVFNSSTETEQCLDESSLIAIVDYEWLQGVNNGDYIKLKLHSAS